MTPCDSRRQVSASKAKRLIHMDEQDVQDFSGNGRLGILSIGKPAPNQRPSRLPVQEPLVLSILLILCIHVRKKIGAPEDVVENLE